jgi:hypothetical protein
MSNAGRDMPAGVSQLYPPPIFVSFPWFDRSMFD